MQVTTRTTLIAFAVICMVGCALGQNGMNCAIPSASSTVSDGSKCSFEQTYSCCSSGYETARKGTVDKVNVMSRSSLPQQSIGANSTSFEEAIVKKYYNSDKCKKLIDQLTYWPCHPMGGLFSKVVNAPTNPVHEPLFAVAVCDRRVE
eukprot:TRINITY_DN2002_c2_g1_i3.p1 TRINITY_DN2002_c2_g1~~TRINITY_DN2002_c2_g1_i3.p1  ORF type:complete len:148 (+),score=16.69 TRINITY_DN2002_c2_g1_i3:1-444(+)